MVTRIVMVWAFVLSFGLGQAWAIFESNKTLSDKARITMIEAIKAAEKNIPGKPVEVKMGKDEGRVVYEVELIDKNNKNRWVYVDAADGKVVESK
jgi:uncharacterized membrane protein YkoI